MEIERKYAHIHAIWRPGLLFATMLQVCMCIISASFANVLHFCFSCFSAVVSAAACADLRYTTLILNCFMQVTLGSGLVYVDLLSRIDKDLVNVPTYSVATKWLIFSFSLLSLITTIALLFSQKNVVFRGHNVLSDVTSILDAYNEAYEEDGRLEQAESENNKEVVSPPPDDVVVTVKEDKPVSDHPFLATDTRDFVEAIAEHVLAKNVEKLHMASVTAAANIAAAFTSHLMITDIKKTDVDNGDTNTADSPSADVCNGDEPKADSSPKSQDKAMETPLNICIAPFKPEVPVLTTEKVPFEETQLDPVIVLSESITDVPTLSNDVERLIFEKSQELEDVLYKGSDETVPSNTTQDLDPGHGVLNPTSPLVLIGSINSIEVVDLVENTVAESDVKKHLDEHPSPTTKLNACEQDHDKTTPAFEALEKRFENLENEVKRIADISTERVLQDRDTCVSEIQSASNSPVIKIEVQLAICDKTYGDVSTPINSKPAQVEETTPPPEDSPKDTTEVITTQATEDVPEESPKETDKDVTTEDSHPQLHNQD